MTHRIFESVIYITIKKKDNMLNAFINYKYFAKNLARFSQRLRLVIAYALVNQHIGSLFSQPSQNQILMVEKGAFLVSRKTNLYVGVHPGSNSVTVQVMRRRQATDQAMHKFFFDRLKQQISRSGNIRQGFA